jgi:hypothetical protein
MVNLPWATAMNTGNAVKVVHNVEPNHGQITEGKIVAMLTLEPNSISDVRTIIIDGKVVAEK